MLFRSDLVLAYDIAHDTFGHGKFESLWHGPYIIQHCLTKGAYILASPEGLTLKEPVNELYLKNFMLRSSHATLGCFFLFSVFNIFSLPSRLNYHLCY